MDEKVCEGLREKGRMMVVWVWCIKYKQKSKSIKEEGMGWFV